VSRTSTVADVLAEITVSSSRPAQAGTTLSTVGFLVRTLTTEQGSRPLCCPDCQLLFNLLQPDENEPGRLLGTCDGCSKWYFLVELEPDWRRTILVELPAGEVIERKLAEAKASASGRPGTGP
jgi:hypothetical protein